MTADSSKEKAVSFVRAFKFKLNDMQTWVCNTGNKCHYPDTGNHVCKLPTSPLHNQATKPFFFYVQILITTTWCEMVGGCKLYIEIPHASLNCEGSTLINTDGNPASGIHSEDSLHGSVTCWDRSSLLPQDYARTCNYTPLTSFFIFSLILARKLVAKVPSGVSETHPALPAGSQTASKSSLLPAALRNPVR